MHANGLCVAGKRAQFQVFRVGFQSGNIGTVYVHAVCNVLLGQSGSLAGFVQLRLYAQLFNQGRCQSYYLVIDFFQTSETFFPEVGNCMAGKDACDTLNYTAMGWIFCSSSVSFSWVWLMSKSS
jgi:hypothetical protein